MNFKSGHPVMRSSRENEGFATGDVDDICLPWLLALSQRTRREILRSKNSCEAFMPIQVGGRLVGMIITLDGGRQIISLAVNIIIKLGSVDH